MIIPMNRLDSSIWPIVGTLSGITTPTQSEPWYNVNEGVLLIPQTLRQAPHHQMHFIVIPPARNVDDI